GFPLTAAVASLRGLPSFLPVEVVFPLAAVLGFLVFPRWLPVRPNDTLVLLTKVGLMVPMNPAACQASFTALVLPWGLSWRNSFKKLVLPGVAVAVLGSLGADFSLAAVLVSLPRRLPVKPICALVLLTTVGLMVPSNPAACQASFTVLVVPSGW